MGREKRRGSHLGGFEGGGFLLFFQEAAVRLRMKEIPVARTRHWLWSWWTSAATWSLERGFTPSPSQLGERGGVVFFP